MPKLSEKITNQKLAALLTRLGFEMSRESEKFHRAWRHAETGTILFLPVNKIDEPSLAADLLSVRTHLDFNGLLESHVFDEFVETGNLSLIS